MYVTYDLFATYITAVPARSGFSLPFEDSPWIATTTISMYAISLPTVAAMVNTDMSTSTQVNKHIHTDAKLNDTVTTVNGNSLMIEYLFKSMTNKPPNAVTQNDFHSKF